VPSSRNETFLSIRMGEQGKDGGKAMETRVVEVALPNGATALVRAIDVEGSAPPRPRSEVDFRDVAATLEGLSGAIKSALEEAAPQKTTVELGIELAVKSGKLPAYWLEGQGTAAV
jgi:hypothetical protein